LKEFSDITGIASHSIIERFIGVLNRTLHALKPFRKRRIVLFFCKLGEFFFDNPPKHCKASKDYGDEENEVGLHRSFLSIIA
jgi:hypothetical protein